MNAFISKLAILGLVAGGFFFTGDLKWLIDNGRRIAEKTTVPQAAGPFAGPPAPMPAAPAVPAAHSAVPAAPAAVAPPPPPAPPSAPAPAPEPDLAAASEPAHIPMPTLDRDAVDLASQKPGSRVMLLVDGHVIALDIVDGPAGEVLEHRHVVHADRSVTVASTGVPRRMQALGSSGASRFGGLASPAAPGRIARGEWLQMVPAGQRGKMPPELIGPIQSIGVE